MERNTRRVGLAVALGGALLVAIGGCSLLQSAGPKLQNWEPVLSPDETRIAYATVGGGDDDTFDLVVRDLSSGQEHQVTDDEFFNASPSWSPDGTRLVFASERNDNVDLYIIDVTSLEVTRLTTHEGQEMNPHWGRDDRILFNSNRSGQWEVFSIDPAGENLIRLTDTPADD